MHWYTMSKQSELERGPGALVYYEQTVRAGEGTGCTWYTMSKQSELERGPGALVG